MNLSRWYEAGKKWHNLATGGCRRINRRLTLACNSGLLLFALTGCSGGVPELDRLACKWQTSERVETLPGLCGMVVAVGDALIVKEGDELACGEGEPSCLWLLPGESAEILENTLSLESHDAWIQDADCARPPTCEEARAKGAP